MRQRQTPGSDQTYGKRGPQGAAATPPKLIFSFAALAVGAASLREARSLRSFQEIGTIQFAYYLLGIVMRYSPLFF